MPQATITEHTVLDRGDSFITYRLKGTIDGKPFGTEWEIEIDGRDIEINDLYGEPTDSFVAYENFEAVLAVFTEIAQLP